MGLSAKSNFVIAGLQISSVIMTASELSTVANRAKHSFIHDVEHTAVLA
jgi:hypothetical protein